MWATLITFLGGATARLALGNLFDFVTKWQDAKNELSRLRLMGELDAAQHERNLAAYRLQAELGIKVIEAQTEAHVSEREADAFLEAVKATGQRTGIYFIDLWNGCIRPALATLAMVLWMAKLVSGHFTLDEWDRNLIGLALGVFVGGRIHQKGG